MTKIKTLKEQHRQRQMILEAISDADLNKLNDTFEQFDDLLGDINLPSVQQALDKARKAVTQAASRPGDALPNSVTGSTIAQLLMLQSMLLGVFQSLPKIMRVVKGNLPKMLTNTRMSESSVSRLRSRGRMLLEKEFDASELGGSGPDLELDTGESKPATDRQGVVTYDAMVKRMYKQAKEQGLKDLPATPKAFGKKVVRPAMEELDIKMQPGGARGKFTETEVNQILDKVFSTKRPEIKTRRKSRPGADRNEMAKVPVWSFLRQQGSEGQNAIADAQKLIAQAMRPKGFLNKLKFALKGGELPFGLSADKMAQEILSLPLVNFLQLVDRSRRAGQMELPIEKAQEIADTAEQTKGKGAEEEAVVDTGSAKAGGKKMSVNRLERALQSSQLPKNNQRAVVSFFKNNLVGKGPIEFIE